jgi:tetratricopeptide (TPR) repeat protein
MKYLLLNLALVFICLLNHSSAQDIESYMNQATEARGQMELDNAYDLYSKVLELDSNNIEALYYRGWCKNLWDKSKGLKDFHKVLELDSLHEGALHSLSVSYSILGDYELAKSFELRAIAINPKTAGNLLSQARMANSSNEYEKSIEFCNEGIKLEDDAQNWLLYLERAEAYYFFGKYEKSIADFEKCFNEFGYGMYSCNNYEMCGDAYEGLGNTNRACEYWKIAVRNNDPEFDPASDEVKIKVEKNCNK